MTADDSRAVPDTEAVREALDGPEFRRMWHQHAATIVRATLARDVPAPVEPDGEDDGVLLWMAALDVQMDNTSPGNIPPRFVVGDVEMTAQAATGLRDALAAAITEAQR